METGAGALREEEAMSETCEIREPVVMFREDETGGV